ncbi:MAG: RNA polymerase sigma factor [Flavobacteriales bacterium]|nr:RNA polymerase sigma factor [Flavobacteriales bacterium]
MTESDKKEFLALYDKIHEPLMRFCMVKSRGIMDPRDLANDVLLVGMENFHKLENKQALLSYLFSTANNICLNQIRRKKFSGPYDEEKADKLEGYSSDVETAADVSVLYEALDKLPPLQKEAVVLFEISDLPIKEIMTIQNSGESAVKQRIKRGREKLAALLQEKKKRRPAMMVAMLFLTTNSFSMSNLDSYFEAAKKLSLPLSKEEAVSSINQYQLTAAKGGATASGGKLGAGIAKKGLIGGLITGGVITASVLLYPSAEENTTAQNVPTNEAVTEEIVEPQNNANPEQTIAFTDVKSEPKELQEESKTEGGISDETPKAKPNPESIPTATFVNDSIKAPKDTKPPKAPRDKKRTKNRTNKGIAPIMANDEAPDHWNSEKVTFSDEKRYPAEDVKSILFDHLGENVIVKTWNEKAVLIETDHIIEAKTEEDKQLIMQRMNHSVDQKGSQLKISSNSGCKKNKYCSSGGKRYSTITFKDGKKAKYKELERNFVITIPKEMDVVINGRYETFTIANDLKGNMEASLFATELTTASIEGNVNMKINYGRASMGDMKDGKISLMDTDLAFGTAEELDLNVKYCNVSGRKATAVTVSLFDGDMNLDEVTESLDGNIRYSNLSCHKSSLSKSSLTAFDSNIKLGSVKDMSLELRYSKLIADNIDDLKLSLCFDSYMKVESIQNFTAKESKYSEYKIEQLTESIDILSYDDVLSIGYIDTKMKSFDFRGKYTSYKLNFPDNSDYRISMKGNYLDVSNDSDVALSMDKDLDGGQPKEVKGYLMEGNDNSVEMKFDCFDSEIKFATAK